MQSIKELDIAVSALGSALFESVPFAEWRSVRLISKYAPHAGVSKHDFDFVLLDGSPGLNRRPRDADLEKVERLTKGHWQLTQDLGLPRWHKMTVTVEHTGKFSVQFEYKDDYKEGDIMRRA